MVHYGNSNIVGRGVRYVRSTIVNPRSYAEYVLVMGKAPLQGNTGLRDVDPQSPLIVQV